MNSSAIRSPTTSTRRLENPSIRLQQPLPALGLAGQGMDGTSDQHSGNFRFRCRTSGRHDFRRSTSDCEVSSCRGGEVVDDGVGHESVDWLLLPRSVRSRFSPALPPRQSSRASATSSHRSPTVNERRGSIPSSRDGAVDQPSPGLAAVADARVLGHLAVGMVRTIVIRVDVCAAPREQPSMCACTACTTDSVKNPRATPDWFVTITMRRPARLSARMRVDAVRDTARPARADRDSRLLR